MFVVSYKQTNKVVSKSKGVGVVISFLQVFNHLIDITTSSRCLDKTNKNKQ